MIKIEDKALLLATREKGRRGVMAGHDFSLRKREEAHAEKQLVGKEKQEIKMVSLNQAFTIVSCITFSSS